MKQEDWMPDDSPTVLPADVDRGTLPGMVRAIASVGLMYALLGLACQPFTALSLPSPGTEGGLMLHTPHAIWMLVTTIGGVGLSVLLLIASVGCLNLRAWGWMLMVLYCALALALGLGGIWFYLRWLGFFGETPAPQRGVIGFIALAGWFFGILFAAGALFGMTRPHVKRAFRG